LIVLDIFTNFSTSEYNYIEEMWGSIKHRKYLVKMPDQGILRTLLNPAHSE